ncbi:MAG: acyltransferase [Hyphomicrobiales bacterium]|nr:acyltransferase [Hyphomicrobiales bacterium]
MKYPVYRTFALWRFICAMIIVAYHLAHFKPEMAASLPVFERFNPLLDTFFMVSGFLIFQHYGSRVGDWASYKSFIARRIVRIYPLHLLTLAFFVAIGIAVHAEWVVSASGKVRYDWSQLPAQFYLLQGWGVSKDLSFNYVSWSLSAEWFCYLALPVIVFAFVRFGAAGMAILLVSTVLVLETLVRSGVMPDVKGWWWAKEWGAYRAFADFILGALVFKLADASTLRLRSLWPAWAAMATATAMMAYEVHFYLVWYVLAAALYLAAVAENNDRNATRWINPMMPVLNASFGVYLWHPVVITLMTSLLWNWYVAHWGFIGLYPYLAFVAVVSVLVAFVSMYFVEARMTRFLQGWLEARIARRTADKNAYA